MSSALQGVKDRSSTINYYWEIAVQRFLPAGEAGGAGVSPVCQAGAKLNGQVLQQAEQPAERWRLVGYQDPPILFSRSPQFMEPLPHSGQSYARRCCRWSDATQDFQGHATSVVSSFKDHSVNFSAKSDVDLRGSGVPMYIG
jgi:hypothetical protein